MPRLTRDIDVVLTGDIYPSRFATGTSVSGEVARVAREMGALELPQSASPERKVEVAAPESKRAADTAPAGTGALAGT